MWHHYLQKNDVCETNVPTWNLNLWTGHSCGYVCIWTTCICFTMNWRSLISDPIWRISWNHWWSKLLLAQLFKTTWLRTVHTSFVFPYHFTFHTWNWISSVLCNYNVTVWLWMMFHYSIPVAAQTKESNSLIVPDDGNLTIPMDLFGMALCFNVRYPSDCEVSDPDHCP